MFVKKAGEPARDFDQLTGDPWEHGIINDAPDHEAVARDLEAYEQALDAQVAACGVSPDTEAWHTVRQAIMAKDTMGGDPALMQHGHTLESTYSKRDFYEYSGDSVRQVVGQQKNFVDGLWAEYANIYGAEAANDERLGPAVQAVLQDLRRQGYNPAEYARQNMREFLMDVDTRRSLGHGPSRSTDTDYGRTSGIGARGGFAPEPSTSDGTHPYDDPDRVGMVAEMRDLQRKRGWA
jgi:hypothetical protein